MLHIYDTLAPYDPSAPSEPVLASDTTNIPGCMVKGCLTLLMALALMVSIIIITSCASPNMTAGITEQHTTDKMMKRIDSLLTIRTVNIQDSAWRESVVRQLQYIREISDTSHTVVVDSEGKIIRERIVINNTRDAKRMEEQQEQQVMMHRMEATEATISIMQQQISSIDSMMRQEKRTVERIVEKKLTQWQNARIWIANIVLVALAVLAALWMLRKRTWWTRIIK